MNQDLQRTAGSVFNVLSSYLALRQVQAESVAQQRKIDQDAQLLRGEFSRLMRATDERSAVLRQVFAELNTAGNEEDIKVLLSAKLQNATISLSAMPINRRCGLLFGKVSPPFRLSFIGCPLKRENGRHEMWPNVFFKPLRALEYGEFY